jgi:hypothetical protein
MSWLVVLGFVVLVWLVVRTLLRHRSSVFSARGYGVRADIGYLNDAPRVRIQGLAPIGHDRTRIAFVPSDGSRTGEPDSPVADAFIVELSEQDAGFELLRQWLNQEADLAIVVPPASRIIRLRSISDLQPLTLRRIDS